MERIESIRELPHAPLRIFEFLSDLHNHWQLEDSFIAVNGVGNGGGRILIRGPLGITREARTEVVEAEAPSRLVGRAVLGTTVGAVAWKILPEGDGSLVSLSAEVERASAADRLLLVLGGRRWLRRRFANVLETLDRRLG
jgi:Polyketide cyclase / dehydrase and lipid transport